MRHCQHSRGCLEHSENSEHSDCCVRWQAPATTGRKTCHLQWWQVLPVPSGVCESLSHADGQTDGRTAIFAATAAAAGARRTGPRPRRRRSQKLKNKSPPDGRPSKKKWLRTAGRPALRLACCPALRLAGHPKGRTKKKEEKIKVCLKR